jgi:putative oxidoreductase
MQRLFSTFPGAWPGVGLLLLRLALGTAVIHDALQALQRPGSSAMLIPALAELFGAALLIVGLCTPIVAVLLSLIALGTALEAGRLVEPLLLQAAIGLGLALVGPGAWSTDARLFGRRRVEITQRRED